MEKYGIEHGLSVYYKFYTKEEEQQFGVVAIRLKVI
jgi:ASC-1-like (ASCH) protein